MHIILTHEQADFDALASLLGAHLVDERAIPVLPRRMNRNVRAFVTLYGVELPFVDPRDLPGMPVESVTLVDTQSMVSIKGMGGKTHVRVIDHHLPRDGLPPTCRSPRKTNSYDALWKASRAIVDIADVIPATDKDVKERQKTMYTEATALGRKAVAVNPNDTWGHFQYAAANGKRLLLLGKKEQIEASKAVRKEIDKALELDPTNHLAWHALGRWHRRMDEIGGAKRFFGGIIYGSIPKGSFVESEKALQKAIELHPEYVIHYLELGRTLVALEKYDEAAEAFQKCIDLPKSISKDDVVKEEAKAELAALKTKKK